MDQRITGLIAIAIAAAGFGAGAQQPAPAFAAPNLSEKGVRSMAEACSMCHGPGGHSLPGATVPGLAGRPAAEVVEAMNQFKGGTRPATIMHQIAKGYSDTEVGALADYFSRQR